MSQVKIEVKVTHQNKGDVKRGVGPYFTAVAFVNFRLQAQQYKALQRLANSTMKRSFESQHLFSPTLCCPLQEALRTHNLILE